MSYGFIGKMEDMVNQENRGHGHWRNFFLEDDSWDKFKKMGSRHGMFTMFPWLAAAKLLASMATFSFATALAELSREFRKKNPLQVNQKIRTLNRGWGFNSTWLQYRAWVHSLPANNNSEGSYFT